MNGWWEEMFELPAWQAVQLGWEALEDADHHVDLIVRATGSRAGMRVLDVPCGTETGRPSIVRLIMSAIRPPPARGSASSS